MFVATAGNGSMDRYSQKLAERLPVVKLETDIYQRSAEGFERRAEAWLPYGPRGV